MPARYEVSHANSIPSTNIYLSQTEFEKLPLLQIPEDSNRQTITISNSDTNDALLLASRATFDLVRIRCQLPVLLTNQYRKAKEGQQTS